MLSSHFPSVITNANAQIRVTHFMTQLVVGFVDVDFEVFLLAAIGMEYVAPAKEEMFN
jgi:hypothetical protein